MLVTCWYLKTKQNPNACQWNIDRVGSPMQNSCVGHVHFMFFVLISLVWGSQREPSFQWNIGFSAVLRDVIMEIHS